MLCDDARRRRQAGRRGEGSARFGAARHGGEHGVTLRRLGTVAPLWHPHPTACPRTSMRYMYARFRYPVPWIELPRCQIGAKENDQVP
jgi:hypothetical protein